MILVRYQQKIVPNPITSYQLTCQDEAEDAINGDIELAAVVAKSRDNKRSTGPAPVSFGVIVGANEGFSKTYSAIIHPTSTSSNN